MQLKHFGILAILATILTGCASTSSNEDNPDLGLDGVRSELVNVNEKITITQKTLADFTQNPTTDLEAKFDRFEMAFNDTVATARQLRARAEQMRSSGRKIMAQWALEAMPADDTATVAARQEFIGQYETLNTRFAETREALTPYMQDLYDTIGFLRTDLNETRVIDIRDMAKQSADDAKVVQDCVNLIIRELDALHAMMPPAGTK